MCLSKIELTSHSLTVESQQGLKEQRQDQEILRATLLQLPIEEKRPPERVSLEAVESSGLHQFTQKVPVDHAVGRIIC